MDETAKSCEQREKYWIELTPDEKCERLRAQFKRIERHIYEVSVDAEALDDHQHGADGKILISLQASRVRGITGFGKAQIGLDREGKVYF